MRGQRLAALDPAAQQGCSRCSLCLRVPWAQHSALDVQRLAIQKLSLGGAPGGVEQVGEVGQAQGDRGVTHCTNPRWQVNHDVHRQMQVLSEGERPRYQA